MRYAIVINLDYDSNTYEECHSIWEDIRTYMMDAGFRIEGRLFTTTLDGVEACEVARNVMDQINELPEYQNIDLYGYLKEFYGYDHTKTVNLLLPPEDTMTIEIGDLDKFNS
jgi:hypothetical protein